MFQKTFVLATVALLAILANSSRVHAWGCARHVGYTHYSPATGVHHVGYTTAARGGAGYGAAGGYHYSGYHYGGYGAYGGGARYGYVRRY